VLAAHVIRDSDLEAVFNFTSLGRGTMRLAHTASNSNVGAAFVLAFLASGSLSKDEEKSVNNRLCER
jgi:hypothetical protein